MNVLEIHPDFSWWFEGECTIEIDQLRAAAQLQSPEDQTAALERLLPARAYYMVGDAATFDLIQGTFDEVIVCYHPNSLKRLVLIEHIQGWLSPSGQVRFDSVIPPEHQTDAEDYAPLRPYLKLR